jgi:hypothetical protein
MLGELSPAAPLFTAAPVPVLLQTPAHPLGDARRMGYITLSNQYDTISDQVAGDPSARGGRIAVELWNLPFAEESREPAEQANSRQRNYQAAHRHRGHRG